MKKTSARRNDRIASFPLVANGARDTGRSDYGIKRGSSQELSKYMGDKVNLVLQGRSTNVDKQKATAMMQEFFTKNKVSGFNVNHQGKRDESSFVIGTLATTNGTFV